MAGDWVKLRVDLDLDPAVIAVAEALRLDEILVVGVLWKFWAWANLETHDGFAPGITARWIDRYVRRPGFSAALVKVGWLRLDPDGMRIPDFEAHNGESAKSRALAVKRMSRHRRNKSDGAGVTKSSPEKRREEKSLRDESLKNPSCPEPAVSPASGPELPKPGGKDHNTQTAQGIKSPAVGDREVLLVFPVVGARPTEWPVADKWPAEWPLCAGKVREYTEAFPGLDVPGHCQRALQWVRDNPTKRKTFRGMPAFLWKWLAREQNLGHAAGPAAAPRRAETVAETVARLKEEESRCRTRNGTPG